jgi:hypothetical protein
MDCKKKEVKWSKGKKLIGCIAFLFIVIFCVVLGWVGYKESLKYEERLKGRRFVGHVREELGKMVGKDEVEELRSRTLFRRYLDCAKVCEAWSPNVDKCKDNCCKKYGGYRIFGRCVID